MYTETPGQKRARLAIRAEVADRHWLDPDLAERAGIHRDTVRDVLAGEKWPNRTTRAKIEAAIGWPVETIQNIAEGHADVPPLRSSLSSDEHADRLEHISPAERALLLSVLEAHREATREIGSADRRGR